MALSVADFFSEGTSSLQVVCFQQDEIILPVGAD
jgi:hypothetical protein